MLVLAFFSATLVSGGADALANQSLEQVRSDRVTARYLFGQEHRVQAEVSVDGRREFEVGTYRLGDGELCFVLDRSGTACWAWPRHLGTDETVTVGGLDGDEAEARFTLRAGHSAALP